VLAATSRGFAIDDMATEMLTPGSHPQAGSSSLALAAKRRTCGLEAAVMTHIRMMRYCK
jgi:hypothetical protein